MRTIIVGSRNITNQSLVNKAAGLYPRPDGRPRIIVSGKRYGSLIVTNESRRAGKYLLWLCTCDCGKTCWATASDLHRLHKSSCGICPSRAEKARKSPIRGLYGTYRRGAQKRNHLFELTIEEFEALIKSKCRYCGSEPTQVYHKRGAREGVTYNGVDRVDNSIGYTKSNSVPCCKFCNLAKSRWKLSDFLAWIERIKDGQNM